MTISNPFFDNSSFDDFYSKRLSDFGSSDFNTKTAGSFVDPLISRASQKPDLNEFLSTARSSGPRLQSLAGQLPDLSNLRAETTGNIEDMPSFKAAMKAYEAGVEPGVINQMTLRGLGSGSALAGALGRTRAGAMLPIIQNEQARRDQAIQSIAGYEDTANARKLGAAETSDQQLLRALLSQAGFDENEITRALGAAQTATGQVLNTGLTETGRTFTAGENEKQRQLQLKLGELQRQGMLGFAGGQFGAAALPTLLGLAGLGKNADGTQTSLIDKLFGSKPGDGGAGGISSQGLQALASATGISIAKLAASLASSGGVSALAPLINSMLESGDVQGALALIEKASLGTPGISANNLSDFDAAAQASSDALGNQFGSGLPIGEENLPNVANEVSGMLPASQAGEFGGLGPFGAAPQAGAMLGAEAPNALSELGGTIANSSVGKFLGSGFNTAESLAQSIGLPAGLGIFASGAGAIGGFVHLLMSLFPSNEEAKAQKYSKAVEAQISANPAAWTQKIAKDYGPQFGPFASKMGQFSVDVITGKAQSNTDFRRILGIPDFVPDMAIEELNLFNSDAMYKFGPLSAAANIEQNTKLPSFLQALPNLTPERPYVDLQNPGQGLTEQEAALSGKYPRLEQTLIDSGKWRRNQDGDLVPNFRYSEAGDLVQNLPREQGE